MTITFDEHTERILQGINTDPLIRKDYPKEVLEVYDEMNDVKSSNHNEQDSEEIKQQLMRKLTVAKLKAKHRERQINAMLIVFGTMLVILALTFGLAL